MKSRARGPSRRKRPVQPAFSRKPLSQSADRRSGPGRQLSGASFMPRDAAAPPHTRASDQSAQVGNPAPSGADPQRGEDGRRTDSECFAVFRLPGRLSHPRCAGLGEPRPADEPHHVFDGLLASLPGRMSKVVQRPWRCHSDARQGALASLQGASVMGRDPLNFFQPFEH
jgi:hypothetical protein